MHTGHAIVIAICAAATVAFGCNSGKGRPSSYDSAPTMSLQEFDEYTHQLQVTWRSRDKDFGQFDEYEQETIALYLLNSDYGGNGLPDYFAWQGFSSLDYTLRGLNRIGASRLATIVREYADLLREHGFEPTTDNVYDFINDCPSELQGQFDARQVEAARLCSDFYRRWEAYYVSRTRG